MITTQYCRDCDIDGSNNNSGNIDCYDNNNDFLQ